MREGSKKSKIIPVVRLNKSRIFAAKMFDKQSFSFTFIWEDKEEWSGVVLEIYQRGTTKHNCCGEQRVRWLKGGMEKEELRSSVKLSNIKIVKMDLDSKGTRSGKSQMQVRRRYDHGSF